MTLYLSSPSLANGPSDDERRAPLAGRTESASRLDLLLQNAARRQSLLLTLTTLLLSFSSFSIQSSTMSSEPKVVRWGILATGGASCLSLSSSVLRLRDRSTDVLVAPTLVALPNPPAISKVFAGDILLDPATRGVTDVRHEVVAVGSRTQEKARAFADSFGLTACKAYGGYDGVFADEVRNETGRGYMSCRANAHSPTQNVDIVYVGQSLAAGRR